MRNQTRKHAVGLIALLIVAACGESPNPISIDAMGGIDVTMYLDRDGNGVFDPGVDVPASGLGITLLSSARQPVDNATAQVNGGARFGPIPVGRYRIGVPASALGDSLVYESEATPWIDVLPGDTTAAQVPVSYPTISVAQLATAPIGRVVAVRGVALNAVRAFSDSLFHVVEDGVVARALTSSTSGPVAVGDTVRVLGRVGLYQGRRALLGASAYSLGTGPEPAPLVLTVGQAASANGGSRDGALVTVVGARVLSVTNLPEGGRRVRVSDPTGLLDIVIDRSVSVVTADPLVPGADVTVTGVLVPVAAEGVWSLRPRGSADVNVSISAATVSAVRTLPIGSAVSVTGVALNGVAGFDDSSLHVADVTGAIRVLALNTSFVFAGDEVRVSGVTSIVEGRVVIAPANVAVLGQTTVPPPSVVSTSVASTASGGSLDAALVQVRNVLVETVDLVAGGVALGVDDGSGRLIVRVDGGTGIPNNVLAVGARANVVGLLVPRGDGTWLLKPRSAADITPA
jgi:hypothetical protein